MSQLGIALFYWGVTLSVFGIFVFRKPNIISWIGKLPGDVSLANQQINLPFSSFMILSLLFFIAPYLLYLIFPII
jgi:hypothetical protein